MLSKIKKGISLVFLPLVISCSTTQGPFQSGSDKPELKTRDMASDQSCKWQPLKTVE